MGCGNNFAHLSGYLPPWCQILIQKCEAIFLLPSEIDYSVSFGQCWYLGMVFGVVGWIRKAVKIELRPSAHEAHAKVLSIHLLSLAYTIFQRSAIHFEYAEIVR